MAPKMYFTFSMQGSLFFFFLESLQSPTLISNIGSVRETEMVMLNDRKCVVKGGVTCEGRLNSLFFQVNEDVCPGMPCR